MIPCDYITEWRSEAPWGEDYQLVQDLVISKALIDIFSHPLLGRALAFRGATQGFWHPVHGLVMQHVAA